jgi:hypothetical protein
VVLAVLVHNNGHDGACVVFVLYLRFFFSRMVKLVRQVDDATAVDSDLAYFTGSCFSKVSKHDQTIEW